MVLEVFNRELVLR